MTLGPDMDAMHLIWPDSEVAAVAWQDDGRLTLRFAAALVRQDGVAGDDSEPGFLCGVLLHCEGVARRPDALADALGRLAEGRWLVNGQPMRGWALGMALQGALQLQLRFANGCELDIGANRAHTECPPGATFRPSLAC
jgi:hypothetical protein